MSAPGNNRSKIKESEQEIWNQAFDDIYNIPVAMGIGHDGQYAQRNLAQSLAYMFDYTGGANPVYIGVASPGTLTSTAKWQIKKLTYDASDNVTSIQWAGGTPNFDYIWDNRATLYYA